MEQTEEKFHIIQITQFDDELILQIDSLLDEGTVWDKIEGEKFLKNTDNVLLAAFWDKTTVGFLTAYRLQRFDKRKAEVLLYEIGVHEDFRRNGIGKALIEELKKWAKEVEADEVWVLTNKSNAEAVALYQSVGGVTESTDEQMYVLKV